VHTNNVADEKPAKLLTEYYPQGSMKGYLHEYGPMQPKAWLNFVRDVSRGMAYLTSNDVIHGCLRPSCVLLAEDGGCAVTKFGLSPPNASSVDHLFYCAPELLEEQDTEPLTPACDVWSLGITAMEFLGVESPLRRHCGNNPEKYRQLFRSKGLEQHHLSEMIRRAMAGMQKGVVDFVVMCLEISKITRPTIGDAKSVLERLVISDATVGAQQWC
jgi:serine/threonine protein kinase